jgi:phage tail tape-measure protein
MPDNPKPEKKSPPTSKDFQIPPIPKQTAGAVTGAAVGSIAGPVGAVVGGVVGALAGKAASSEAASSEGRSTRYCTLEKRTQTPVRKKVPGYVAKRRQPAVTRQGFDRDDISKIVRSEGAKANCTPAA